MSVSGILSELDKIGCRVVLLEAGPVIRGERKGEVSPDLLARMKANREAILHQVEMRAAFETLAEILATGTPCPAPPDTDPIGTLPPSWSSNRDPLPGDSCFCCFRSGWWRRSGDTPGWCCATCHPHPPGAAVVIWKG